MKNKEKMNLNKFKLTNNCVKTFNFQLLVKSVQIILEKARSRNREN